MIVVWIVLIQQSIILLLGQRLTQPGGVEGDIGSIYADPIETLQLKPNIFMIHRPKHRFPLAHSLCFLTKENLLSLMLIQLMLKCVCYLISRKHQCDL